MHVYNLYTSSFLSMKFYEKFMVHTLGPMKMISFNLFSMNMLSQGKLPYIAESGYTMNKIRH